MSHSKAQILLVEDNENYRKVISRALRNQDDIELSQQYGTAEIALRQVEKAGREVAPDAILLDLNLPGMSGIEALLWFRKYIPKTPVIVLTQSKREQDVIGAIQHGATGYLLKSASAQELRDGIRTVLEGGGILDPFITRYLLDTLQRDNINPSVSLELTERETEILECLSEGLEKKEIATTLKISTNTVAYHVKNIYDKLEVTNAPAAVSAAFKKGLL